MLLTAVDDGVVDLGRFSPASHTSLHGILEEVLSSGSSLKGFLFGKDHFLDMEA